MEASELLPAGPPHCHMIATGADSDFVIWHYEGLFTYNLGDSSATGIMAVYEAVCETDEEGYNTVTAVTESIRFYYITLD